MKSDLLAQKFTTPRLTLDERYATGKLLRTKMPREDHAVFQRNAEKVKPIEILLEQAKSRVPQLVPVRHARMLTSPFAYLRGSAAVMAADLESTPVNGMMVQACGDMHVANFGVFASAERNLVFGINDFDETFPAAWEWDVKRLAASAAVVGRFLNGDRIVQQEAAWAVVDSYRKHMREYRKMGYMEVWYAAIDEQDILKAFTQEQRNRAESVIAKARKRTHMQVLDKMTELVDNEQRIIEDSPFIIHATHSLNGRPIKEALGLFLETYMASLGYEKRVLLNNYRVVDIAMKVVGVGSVGTRCWVILLNGAHDEDPLFLQLKEAQKSVLQPYFKSPEKFKNNGMRIVAGQRLIQGSPDIFLGWGEVDKIEFYVRQLRDMKGSAEFIPGESKLSALNNYCALCGWALALAHAKSGDAVMIAGYMGKSDEFIDAVSRFSLRYADQTDKDFQLMKAAAKKGLIEVAKGEKTAVQNADNATN